MPPLQPWKVHSHGQPNNHLDHSVQRHTLDTTETSKNLTQGWSQTQLVPSNCGRMCTLTNEDIVALKCITTKAMNTNSVFIFAFTVLSHGFLGHGCNVCKRVGRPIYEQRDSA